MQRANIVPSRVASSTEAQSSCAAHEVASNPAHEPA
jgi:hypothetical protein